MPELASRIHAGKPLDWTTALDQRVDVELFARTFIGHRPNVFWLDGGPHGTSLFGFGSVVSGAEALDEIDAEIEFFAGESNSGANTTPGFVGWIPYGSTRTSLGEPVDGGGANGTVSFIRADRVVRIDNRTGAIEVAVLPTFDEHALTDWAEFVSETVMRANGNSSSSSTTTPPQSEVTFAWRDDEESYSRKIAECQAEIAEGNAYVLCLTTQVTAVGRWGDIETFLALRAATRSSHGALIRIGDISVISGSPESFIEVDVDRIVRTSPIKGTRRRGADPKADEALRRELQNDPKERAENLMIVDLMRNDLARICEDGTVSVERLFEVQSFAQVHQLVSTVSGRLKSSVGVAELLRAVFPAGSMTGAPKEMAVRLLDRIESGPRGIYAGAFGFVGIDGTLDLAMTIRSIVIHGERATVGTGGGITALSRPDLEVDEIHLKVATPLSALRLRARASH